MSCLLEREKFMLYTCGLFLSPTTTMHQSVLYKKRLTASCGGNMVVTTPHLMQSSLRSNFLRLTLMLKSLSNCRRAKGKVRKGVPVNSWPEVAWETNDSMLFCLMSVIWSPAIGDFWWYTVVNNRKNPLMDKARVFDLKVSKVMIGFSESSCKSEQ